MHHTSYMLTFSHGLRQRMVMRGDRVPCIGEIIVLGEERWRVESVEWANTEETYVVLPTLVLAPTWGLRAELRALAAAAAGDTIDEAADAAAQNA